MWVISSNRLGGRFLANYLGTRRYCPTPKQNLYGFEASMAMVGMDDGRSDLDGDDCAATMGGDGWGEEIRFGVLVIW